MMRPRDPQRFREVGNALADLTRRIGEVEWADLLRENPRAGNPHKDWGATSLENIGYHGVDEAQVPWAEMLLVYLPMLIDQLHFGTFVPYMDRDSRSGASVTVRRCLACGHQVLTSEQMDRSIAIDILPQVIVDALEQGTISTLVDRVLAGDLPEVPARRTALRQAAIAAGIHVGTGGPGSKKDRLTLDLTSIPCERCGKQEDRAESWTYRHGNPPSLEPPATESQAHAPRVTEGGAAPPSE
ncbi:MAG TPA: hypothetical protein VF006_12210 [Longimicrobium sp.]